MIEGRQSAGYGEGQSKLDNAFVKSREESGSQNQHLRKQANPLIPAQYTGFILQNRAEEKTYRG